MVFHHLQKMNKQEQDKLELLKGLVETPAGELLRETCKESFIIKLDVLLNSYQEKQLVEIQALLASINANLDMYRLLTGISKQIEEIRDIYKEEKEE